MSDKELTPRQRIILNSCHLGTTYSLRDILILPQIAQFNLGLATLRRDLAYLCKLNFLEQLGEKKTTKYKLNPRQLLFLPIDPAEYCSVDIDQRVGSQAYNFELFSNIPKSLFSDEELQALNNATMLFVDSSEGASLTIRKKELERFVIELSWKSSKIEGNTYSLLDTELLIKEGIQAAGHSQEEAIMILNHKYAFEFILKAQDLFTDPTFTLIQETHKQLTQKLGIQSGVRKRLIGITGSLYRPLQVPSQIEEACTSLLAAVKAQQDPYSKALLLLAGLCYIQPFEDGNKRTSRLSANGVLLAHGAAPLSYRSISEKAYREAVLVFYERNSLLALKQLFISQYLFACQNYLKIN